MTPKKFLAQKLETLATQPFIPFTAIEMPDGNRATIQFTKSPFGTDVRTAFVTVIDPHGIIRAQGTFVTTPD